MWTNQARAKLTANETIYGPFLRLPGPAGVELAAAAGFDFVIIDLEHSPLDLPQVESMICVAAACGITPLIRVPGVNGPTIHRLLDLGARGIMAPQVNGEAEARILSNATRFAPEGARGMSGPVRGNGWGAVSPAESHTLNGQILSIAQIESEEALEQLDQIAAQPGVDVLFVGPLDLSQALGIPGEVAHPRLREAVDRVIAAAGRHGKHAGIYAGTPAEARHWRERGARMIGAGLDTVMLRNAFAAARRELG